MEPKPESLVDDVAEALRPILTSGLPVSPDYADERLLGLSCVVDRCDDPSSTLNRVKAAEELLREAIAQYPDERLDPAVGVLFGAAVGSKGSNLTDRRALAAKKSDFDADHFRKNIEPKIVRTLAWLVLQRTLKTSEPPSPPIAPPPPDIRLPLRQLYRYAQRTLVCVDVYDLCVDYANALYGVREAALHTFEGVTPDTHSWLMPFSYRDHFFSHPEQHIDQRWTYRKRDVDAHLAPYGQTPESDLALWDYANFHRYLRVLWQQRTGRDYLPEILPSHRWQALQTGCRFELREIDELLSALGEDYGDTPEVFVSSLSRDDQRRTLHTKWLELLGAAVHGERDAKYKELPTWLDRRALSRDLLHACIALQSIFPDETLPDVGGRFTTTLLLVLISGLNECGAPFVASRSPGIVTLTDDGEMLFRDVLARQATRYAVSGNDGGAAWFDDPPRGPVTPQKGGALWSEKDKRRPSGGAKRDPRIIISHRIVRLP